MGVHERTTEINHQQQTRQIQPVPTRQQQRVATNATGQFAEGHDRARESNRTDQDADVDFHLMNRFGGTDETLGGFRVDEGGQTHQHGGQTDHAVHQGDQLGHLRHLHGTRCIQTDGATDQHGGDDPWQTRHGDLRTEHGRQHGQRHADHAVEVAAQRGFLVRQTAQAQNEKNGCPNVGDGCQFCSKHELPPLFAEHGQHALGDGKAAEHIDGGEHNARCRDPTYPVIRSPRSTGQR